MRNLDASSYFCNYDPNEKFRENVYYTNIGGSKMIWLTKIKIWVNNEEMIYTVKR